MERVSRRERAELANDRSLWRSFIIFEVDLISDYCSGHLQAICEPLEAFLAIVALDLRVSAIALGQAIGYRLELGLINRAEDFICKQLWTDECLIKANLQLVLVVLALIDAREVFLAALSHRPNSHKLSIICSSLLISIELNSDELEVLEEFAARLERHRLHFLCYSIKWKHLSLIQLYCAYVFLLSWTDFHVGLNRAFCPKYLELYD